MAGKRKYRNGGLEVIKSVCSEAYWKDFFEDKRQVLRNFFIYETEMIYKFLSRFHSCTI